MDRVHGYLSRHAQTIDRRALVVEREGAGFVLVRPGEPDLALGEEVNGFHGALQAIKAMLRAHRASAKE